MVRLLVLAVVLGAVVALAWMLFLPVVVMAQIRSRTGFEVSAASISCNAFTGKVIIRGLVLNNPASFPVRDFMELREFSAEAELGSLWADRLVLEALTVDFRKVTLVRRADGRSNAEIFSQNLFGLTLPPASTAPLPAVAPAPASVPALPVAAPGPAARPAASGEAPRKFLIRHLTLRFDRLVLEDHTTAKPLVQEHALALDQRYENVTDVQQLLVPEVLRRVAAENLGPVLGVLVPGDFGRALRETARTAADRGATLLKDAEQKGADLFKGLREKLEETRKP
jgi:hypothetical protein